MTVSIAGPSLNCKHLCILIMIQVYIYANHCTERAVLFIQPLKRKKIEIFLITSVLRPNLHQERRKTDAFTCERKHGSQEEIKGHKKTPEYMQ